MCFLDLVLDILALFLGSKDHAVDVYKTSASPLDRIHSNVALVGNSICD